MSDLDLYLKLSSLPKELKKEVADFADFLKSKSSSEAPPKIKREAGLAKGLIYMKKGFDDPLDDFKDYME